MSGPERYLLLALSLLVARQRALLRGEEEPYFFRALREPVLFRFVHQRGAFRCPLPEKGRRELFAASLLVAEGVEFVSPLSALGPHVKLVQAQPGEAPEAKISEELTRRLSLEPDEAPYAVYSPLQVLFTAQSGFFLPHREAWHAYAARCVAARAPGGTFEAAERSGNMYLAYGSPALRFELEVGARGFDCRASGELADLRKFCASGAMPDGVQASLEGSGAMRVRGGGGC